MIPKEGLSKETFWDPLKEKYPAAMKVFCDWIDEYKKQINWVDLFNERLYNDGTAVFNWNGDKVDLIAPKYHSLPIAMQVGIFIEFVDQTTGGTWIFKGTFVIDWGVEITQYIKQLNEVTLSK